MALQRKRNDRHFEKGFGGWLAGGSSTFRLVLPYNMSSCGAGCPDWLTSHAGSNTRQTFGQSKEVLTVVDRREGPKNAGPRTR